MKQEFSALQLFTCPTCGGHQYQPHCPACKGDRVIGVIQGIPVVFRKTFGVFEILERKLEKTSENLIYLAFLSFGMIGAGALAWFLFKNWAIFENDPDWFKIFFQRRWELFLFLLSLIGDGFLYYRSVKKSMAARRVPSVRYQAGGTPEIQEKTAPQEFFALTANQEPQDIYRVLSEPAKDALEKAWSLAGSERTR